MRVNGFSLKKSIVRIRALVCILTFLVKQKSTEPAEQMQVWMLELISIARFKLM